MKSFNKIMNRNVFKVQLQYGKEDIW